MQSEKLSVFYCRSFKIQNIFKSINFLQTILFLFVYKLYDFSFIYAIQNEQR